MISSRGCVSAAFSLNWRNQRGSPSPFRRRAANSAGGERDWQHSPQKKKHPCFADLGASFYDIHTILKLFLSPSASVSKIYVSFVHKFGAFFTPPLPSVRTSYMEALWWRWRRCNTFSLKGRPFYSLN